ncbi:MAG: sulfonate transport system substrate-binding protein [Rhizorhabdus sp.]|nr:sulfonate transport system substrate-binding protein [Rhizorhabdus sp.]
MTTDRKDAVPFWRSGKAIAAFAGLIVLAFALFFATRDGDDRAAQEAATLKIGDQRGGVQALLRAAGELDHVPYKIEWALFPAASPLLEALGAEAIDIGGVGGAPFAFAFASGSKIKAVYAYRPDSARTGKASAIVVRKDSPIRTLADLKGKKLATIRGSAGQDLALKLLEKAGLQPNDVEWVYLHNGESKAALAAGSIDAWSTWGSYVGIAVLEDGDRILVDGSGVPSGVGFYAATDAAIANKHAILADFVERLTRARHWATLHPREYAAELAKETRLPFEVALFSISSYLGPTIPIDDRIVTEQSGIFERYHRAGIIPNVPDVRGGYDSSFNDAVKRAQAAP